MNIKQFDKEYPIYIGVSKREFEEIRKHKKLYADSFEFTDSMKTAEFNALASVPDDSKECGVVIKLNTAKLLEEVFTEEFRFSKYVGDFIQSLTCDKDRIVIRHVFKYILGYYEVYEKHEEHHHEYC